MTSFIDFFSISVGTLVNNKQVLIEVGETEQISDVLVKLNQHGISSVPLYRKKDSNSKEEYSCHGKEYIGIVSTCDIVSFILQNAKLSSTQAVNADMISMQMAMPIKNVLGETLESSLNLAFTVVAPSTPLTHVVDEMFQGLHHCLVIDPERHMSPPKLLGQSDIVKYFLENATVIPEIERALNRSVGDVFQGEGIMTVNEDCPVVDALLKLKTYQAVAVVNEWGQVVSNLSGSDVRDAISKEVDLLSFLSLTVKEFLSTDYLGVQASHPARTSFSSVASDEGKNGTYRSLGVCTTVQGSLLANAQYMVTHHIHRVWVVAPPEAADGLDRFGIACLSLSDIIKAVRTYSTVYVDPLMVIS